MDYVPATHGAWYSPQFRGYISGSMRLGYGRYARPLTVSVSEVALRRNAGAEFDCAPSAQIHEIRTVTLTSPLLPFQPFSTWLFPWERSSLTWLHDGTVPGDRTGTGYIKSPL